MRIENPKTSNTGTLLVWVVGSAILKHKRRNRETERQTERQRQRERQTERQIDR